MIHEPNGPTPTSQYEHSSIPSTVKKLFNLNSNFLTKRDAWAGSFEGLFSMRSTPRTDCPGKPRILSLLSYFIKKGIKNSFACNNTEHSESRLLELLVGFSAWLGCKLINPKLKLSCFILFNFMKLEVQLVKLVVQLNLI